MCFTYAQISLFISFWVENHAEPLSADFKPGFPSCVYCRFTTEKHPSWPVKLTGKAHKIKSSPEALLEKFSKNNTVERL